MKTITTLIGREDVRNVANDLKMVIDDSLIDRVLCEYDDYREQYRDESWSEIVEIMLYDYKRFDEESKESGPFDQLGYEQTKPEIGDDDFEADEESEETRRDFGNDDVIPDDHPFPFQTDGDGGNDVNLNFLG